VLQSNKKSFLSMDASGQTGGDHGMNISVIICAYNEKRWDTLVAAITSVQKQSLPPYEIIQVIDNNPELAIRIRAQFSGISVVENTGPRGLSHARNVGIIHSSGEVVAFIDDDAIADPHWLSQMAACYTDERVVGVGGHVTALWPGGPPVWFPEEFAWVVGCSYRGLPSQAAPVRNFIGCNMSFRRDALMAVSGFNSELGRVGAHPVGCEETELCIRVQRYRPDGILLYEPAAQVQHIIAASRKELRYFLLRCFFEGRSKAKVAQLVGPGDGLSSERSYTMRTLPSGIVFGLRDTLVQHNMHGVAHSCAIFAGLLYTATGYFSGSIGRRKSVPVPLPALQESEAVYKR
jgi:O-antigen biosynthesis protein